jgi:hypothetical protein
MAAVWLDRFECRYEELPPVCIVCGAEATATSRQTFRWHPPWVIVLILVNLLIWAIVALLLTKTMTMDAPVCDEHKGHWFKRKLIGWGAVLLGLAVFAGGVAVSVGLADDPRFRDVAPWGFLVGAVAFLVLLIVAAVVMRSGVRATEITDDDMRLTGVSEGFVEALREQRREERERARGRRRKRDGGYED